MPINLIPPSQLNEMITQVKKEVIKTNPELDPVIKRLHLYYHMRLATFGMDDNSDLIVQFPVLVLPYNKSQHTLYQIEIVQSL